MPRLCEVCGSVEDNDIEGAEQKDLSGEISMNILHVCESCVKDRQHPLF